MQGLRVLKLGHASLPIQTASQSPLPPGALRWRRKAMRPGGNMGATIGSGAGFRVPKPGHASLPIQTASQAPFPPGALRWRRKAMRPGGTARHHRFRCRV